MRRTVEIEIGGVSYPMCLTLRAYSEFIDRYGSMKACFEKSDELAQRGDDKGLMEEYIWMAQTLLEAGYWMCIAQGKDLDAPDTDKLMDAVTPVQLRRLVAEAMVLGQLREVGVDAPKNAGGAGAEPAPES